MPAPRWTRDPEPPPDHRRRLIDSPAKIAVLAIVVALVIAGIAVGAVVVTHELTKECAEFIGFLSERRCLRYE